MNEFLMGANALASLIIALFFLRFWKQTHDRLFCAFSLAFVLLTVTWVGLAATDRDVESGSWFYWSRLLGYVLILAAVVDKNRHSTQRGSPYRPARPRPPAP